MEQASSKNEHEKFMEEGLSIVRGLLPGKDNYRYCSLDYLNNSSENKISELAKYNVYLKEDKAESLVYNLKSILPAQYYTMIDSYVVRGDYRQLLMMYIQALQKKGLPCDFVQYGMERYGGIHKFLVSQGVDKEFVAKDLHLEGKLLKDIGLPDPEEERIKQAERERLAKEQAEKEEERQRQLAKEREEQAKREEEEERQKQLEKEQEEQARLQKEEEERQRKLEKEKEEQARIAIENERQEQIKLEQKRQEKDASDKLAEISERERLKKENERLAKEVEQNKEVITREQFQQLLEELEHSKETNEDLTKTVLDLKSMIENLVCNLQKSNLIEQPEPLTSDELEDILSKLLEGSKYVSVKMLQLIANAYSIGYEAEISQLVRELLAELEKGGVKIG